MRTVVVRYRPAPEHADENQRLVEDVFTELAAVRPDGLRYATWRLDDGTFVHIAQSDEPNPLNSIDAFARFTEDLGTRCRDGEPPNPQPASLVGSFGLVQTDDD